MRFVVYNNQLTRVGNKAKIHISTEACVPICRRPRPGSQCQQDFAGPATCQQCLRKVSKDKQ